MKNKNIRGPLATFVLAIVLLSLGCGGPASNNSNAAQNQNSNAANTATSTGAGSFASACSGTDILVKKAAVENAIQGKVDGDPAFKKQQTKGVFKFQVITEPGVNPESLYVYLGGGIANIGNKFFFHELISSLKDIHKLKCVTKVIFVPVNAIPFKAGPTVTAPAGFEWFGCDTGTIACPGGICAADPPGSCPTIVGDPTATPASNSNTANTNGNGANKTR